MHNVTQVPQAEKQERRAGSPFSETCHPLAPLEELSPSYLVASIDLSIITIAHLFNHDRDLGCGEAINLPASRGCGDHYPGDSTHQIPGMQSLVP